MARDKQVYHASERKEKLTLVYCCDEIICIFAIQLQGVGVFIPNLPKPEHGKKIPKWKKPERSLTLFRASRLMREGCRGIDFIKKQ